MTLPEFLLARIAEDEAVARDVVDADYSLGSWRWEMHRLGPYRSALVNDRGAVVLPPMHDDVYPSRWVAAHIARHDPARVLAECEAKRLRLKIADDLEAEADDDTYRWAHSVAERIRKVEALPYADHPDYRPEWKP